MRTFRQFLASAILAGACLVASAQVSYDTVTATVIDPNSHPYANASLIARLVDAHGIPVSNATTPNGQIYNAKPVQTVLDASGSFSIGLVPNNILSTPSGTQWKFSITFPQDNAILTVQTQWTIVFQIAITANVDLSTQLSTLAQAIQFINLRTGQTTLAGGGGGSMTWPGAAGIPNYSGASSWSATYNASNLIPANFIAALPYLSNTTVLPQTQSGGAHLWVLSYDASTGLFATGRPACGDLSDSGSLCSSSGSLPVTITKVAHQWLDSYDSSTGLYTKSQPSCSDLSNGGTLCASSAALPANTPAVSHQVLNSYNSTTGAFGQGQLGFPDISSLLGCSQLPALTGDATNSSCAMTVVALRGLALPTLAASTGYIFDNNGALILQTPAGGGNVSGSGTSVVGNFTSMNNTTSTAIVDSGKNASSFDAAGAAAARAGTGSCTANQYATATTTGAPTCAQVAYSQVTGTPSLGPLATASPTGVVFGNGASAPTAATSAQIQTVIGAGVYDASGAAAARAAPSACSANQYATATGTSATTCAQVAYSQVSGTPTAPVGTPVGESDLGSLTYNAAGTTTFAAASAFIAGAKVTATHSTSTTFSPTGLVKWGSYTLEILQDATGGGVTFTLGTAGSCSAWKIGGGGSGAITLSTTASAIDLLAFTYDGTNCVANFRTNFN